MSPLRCEMMAHLLQIYVRSFPRLQPFQPPKQLETPNDFKYFELILVDDKHLTPTGRARKWAAAVQRNARFYSKQYPWRPAGRRGGLSRQKRTEAMSIDPPVLTKPRTPPAPPSPRLPASVPRTEDTSLPPEPSPSPPHLGTAMDVDDALGLPAGPRVSSLLPESQPSTSLLPRLVKARQLAGNPSDGFTLVTQKGKPYKPSKYSRHQHALNQPQTRTQTRAGTTSAFTVPPQLPPLLPPLGGSSLPGPSSLPQVSNTLPRSQSPPPSGPPSDTFVHSQVALLSERHANLFPDITLQQRRSNALSRHLQKYMKVVVDSSNTEFTPNLRPSPTPKCTSYCARSWVSSGTARACAVHTRPSYMSPAISSFLLENYNPFTFRPY